MPRRVYVPTRSRGYSNGRYWEKKESNSGSFEETDFCNDCDALTLHKDGQCQLCYNFKSSTADESKTTLSYDTTRQENYKSKMRANKNKEKH
jgi:molybdenum cofactor biosynthesis enzyme MoaA